MKHKKFLQKTKTFKKYFAIKLTLAKANYNTTRNKHFHALQKQKQEYYTYFLNNNKA